MPFSNSARPHQRFEEFPPNKLYEVHVRQFPWRFHPDLAPTSMYGYSFADKSFDATPEHQLFMDVFNFDGFLGNHVTVNGAVKPYLEVDRRTYRLRPLNVGPSRGQGDPGRAYGCRRREPCERTGLRVP